MTTQIAIVGAGMAGLAAARRLRTAGITCTLFDKSRGLGGRMATRREGELRFDHGAQYFTARGPRFRSMVEEWCATGLAAEWFEGAFVGTPGMSGPARGMLAGETVVGGCHVTALRRLETGWTVLTAEGPAAAAGNGAFSAVVLALPAPQVVPLAATAGLAMPDLDGVRYAPCWALMLGYSAPVRIDCDRLRPEEGAIAWIARDSGKPGRSDAAESVVAHATPEWSRRHLEQSPQDVARVLGSMLRDNHGIAGEAVFAAAHRWRYALVERPAGAPCLWDAGSRVGACGDWCLGPRVEAAFDSGEAMAEVIIGSAGAGHGN